ncbi:hypothetical protein EVAR_26725_1 [Eumeta japonica]|uniref:Uncharacterized protein n=1 Tax=Eumeta variegata TaxID=151549 RepID=A0A4C1XAU7_EUMVA|nr:hypothetical protein EVAR_26725_1 [Eumeta japonica]
MNLNLRQIKARLFKHVKPPVLGRGHRTGDGGHQPAVLGGRGGQCLISELVKPRCPARPALMHDERVGTHLESDDTNSFPENVEARRLRASGIQFATNKREISSTSAEKLIPYQSLTGDVTCPGKNSELRKGAHPPCFDVIYDPRLCKTKE